MNRTQATQTFVPKVADVAGVVSWIHIGDPHMTRAGEQNDLDLEAIVNEINTAFARISSASKATIADIKSSRTMGGRLSSKPHI